MKDGRDRDGLSRRRALVAGGLGLAGGLGAVGCGNNAGPQQDGPAAAATSGAVCVMTPEVTQGPYYLDEQLVRNDITEGRPGFPLHLTLTVVDVTESCAPVGETPVEIWHCDAWGYYSGFQENSPGGEVPAPTGKGDTYLRGVQVTGDDGRAAFTSIVPGWYAPRVTHIHVKVHHGGKVGETYQSGTTVQTTQILFPDAICTAYSVLEPYAQHRFELTSLADDQVYNEAETGGGNPDAMVPDLAQIKSGTIEGGYRLAMTLGIDPSRREAD